MDTSKLAHKRYEVPAGFRCKSFILRETCGIDETTAAVVAEAAGKNGSLVMEMLRRSIVAVDDKAVSQPYFEVDSWNTKTRQFLLEAYQELNSVEDEDLRDFKAAGQALGTEELAALLAAK